LDDDVDGPRRVGFNVDDATHIPERDDTGEFNDDDVCRLQRKDTPHHLKGKRIVKDDDDSQLQNILQTLRQKSLDESEQQQHKVEEEDATKKSDNDDEKGDQLSEEQLKNKRKGRITIIIQIYFVHKENGKPRYSQNRWKVKIH